MRTRKSSVLALTLALTAFGAACSGADESDTEEAAPVAVEAAVEMPEFTGDGVWAFLEANEYESWDLWPDKGEKYAGGAPHGALLTTYMNSVASAAFAAGETTFPVGSMVVKNNYMPDGMLAAVTAMIKTEDFNPDNANWWFLKRNADGSYDAEGRFAGCEGCHSARADNDYIMTGPLGADQ